MSEPYKVVDLDGDERYIEIHFIGTHYDVQVRWCDDGEQHEVWEFNTVQGVMEFIQDFYSDKVCPSP